LIAGLGFQRLVFWLEKGLAQTQERSLTSRTFRLPSYGSDCFFFKNKNKNLNIIKFY
jgi:hypothetical protein